jgi:D-sedoheptulose 7-phosphate isomerase
MEVKKQIQEAILLKQELLADQQLMDSLEECIHKMVKCFAEGGKVLFCGNGGSAADAQHLSAELAGKFYLHRDPLPAEALHVNSSFVTSVANDYSFEKVFERMVCALGKPGDMLVALSTSGSSPNIINALEAARHIGMTTIGLTGSKGKVLNELCDILFIVPSADTPRIQEIHILLGHIICENVEKMIFNNKNTL